MILNSLMELFEEYKSTLHVLCDKNDDARWKLLEKRIEYIPTWYQLEFIRYQSQYFMEKSDGFIEISIVIKSGDKDIGIWPLCLEKTNDNWLILSCGQEIMPPLIVGEVLQNPKTKRKYLKILFDFLMGIARIADVEKIHFQESVDNRKVSLWHRYLMEKGAEITNVTHDSICDLSLSENDVKRLMHKTTIQMIRQAYGYYDYEIIDKDSGNDAIDSAIAIFREYHKKIAGRVTRSEMTWELQANSIKANRDFVVFQYDRETHELEGATLFTVTNSHCYYSVAAYNRERFDKAIGHQAQDIAINRLRQLGVRYYIVGDRYYESDGVDAKNINISWFKEAFGTELWLKLHLVLDLGKFYGILQNKNEGVID